MSSWTSPATARPRNGWWSTGALYGEGGLWVRPLAMWQEAVERDGVTYPHRFTYLGD